MRADFFERVQGELDAIEAQGLTKRERRIVSPQSSEIIVEENGERRTVLNFCANNYLGLADHPEIVAALTGSAETNGAGMASVRFICGTQAVHLELERAIADYLGYEDAITFAACFDANGAVFEPLLGPEDAIISDTLNHASIIDGVRLCKAKRYRFKNNDMDDLESVLKTARSDGVRTILIVTDGVFSMDGYIANLKALCDLADTYDALTMVDDCHATGFIGENGRGTPEHCGVEGRIDIITGTFGKALGGGMGGFICAHKDVIALLRQKARPYLFSNALAPPLASAAMKAIELAREGGALRAQIRANAARFRAGMAEAGFELLEGEHPIIPVMLGDAKLAAQMAEALLYEGVYVTAFSYPVVPHGTARIRTQMSAALTPDQIDRALAAFIKVGTELGLIPETGAVS